MARKTWDDYRRQNDLTMREMRVAEFARTDSSYVITLWPANSRTRGGGAIIEVHDAFRAIVLRVLD